MSTVCWLLNSTVTADPLSSRHKTIRSLSMPFTGLRKIEILTGAAGEFIPGIDFSSFGNVADPAVWSQVHDEGTQIVENIVNIRVPVIAAVEGRAHVHSEYALLANVIVA